MKLAAASDLAWAAGLFDAEGSTYAHLQAGRRTPQIAISVPQRDRRILDRFQIALGAGRVFGPYTSSGRVHWETASGLRSRTRSPQFAWRTGSRSDLLLVLAALWPWLGGVKRRQAMRALAKHPAVHELDGDAVACADHLTHWAAGFFEGDGSLSCSPVGHSKSGSYALQLSVDQDHDVEVLVRWRDCFGLTHQVHSYGAQHSLKVCTYAEILPIVCHMWPSLGPVKRDQIRRGLSLYLAHCVPPRSPPDPAAVREYKRKWAREHYVPRRRRDHSTDALHQQYASTVRDNRTVFDLVGGP